MFTGDTWASWHSTPLTRGWLSLPVAYNNPIYYKVTIDGSLSSPSLLLVSLRLQTGLKCRSCHPTHQPATAEPSPHFAPVPASAGSLHVHRAAEGQLPASERTGRALWVRPGRAGRATSLTSFGRLRPQTTDHPLSHGSTWSSATWGLEGTGRAWGGRGTCFLFSLFWSVLATPPPHPGSDGAELAPRLLLQVSKL